MPTIPIYNGPQVREQALRPVQGQAADVSSGYRALGAGLEKVSDEAFRFVERDAQTQAWKAQAQINDEFTKWDAQARQGAQGDNAKGYAQSVEKWWEDAREKYAGQLPPMAREMIGRQLAATRQAALDSAFKYQDQQLDIGERSALQGNVVALTQSAVKAGPDKATVYLDQAAAAMRAYGKKKGIDVEPDVLKTTTGVHTTLINQLMQSDPKAAELYFNTHKDAILPDKWDNISDQINKVSAVADGSAKADELWGTFTAGKDYNQPVDLFGMEAEARKAFANDPTRQAATIQALRERKAAWDASQQEFNAGNTNIVFDMLDRRVPLSKVMQTPAWQALPGAERDKIEYQLESRAAARESRAAARESRAAASENRAFVAEQRRDRQLLMTNADAYLAATDPQKLASMTRPQVQALRSTFGFEATQHLLQRYDSLLKSPGDLTEAKMDEDSFKRVAKDFGLNAYAPKGEEEKAQLGDLKFRTERLIAAAQAKKGSKLTEGEKEEVLRQEFGRTVTVDPGWFSTNQEVPVIRLDGKQARRVVVPVDDRAKIVQALQTRYKANPNNPLFAPTEENVRRLYLLNKSRAANLIPPAK